jgi:hypothetical protein
MKKLTFAADAWPKPATSRFTDAYTTLQHYCQVNYAVPAHRLKDIINPRFEPTVIDMKGSHAIVSAVVFKEKDFHYPKMPFLGNYTFSQTNYRTYVYDKITGQRTVWFFGTTLDHFTIVIPKYLWRFPWHEAAINFETDYC